jgi:hypothetical protein
LDLFELPAGSTWWKHPEIWNWLNREQAHPMMYKYQCFTIKNYHYVDADICFLRNPEDALLPYSGWIAACTEWSHPHWAYTKESAALMYQRASLWKRTTFNAGQFACDSILYDPTQLKAAILRPEFEKICLRYRTHDKPWFYDQPGLNLLVFDSGVKFTNLTLPPINMESTWAGDYPGAYEHLWADRDRMPYLIHWAGGEIYSEKPLNQIFLQYLTRDERAEWDDHVRERNRIGALDYRSRLSWVGKRIFDLKQVVRKVGGMGRGARAAKRPVRNSA